MDWNGSKSQNRGVKEENQLGSSTSGEEQRIENLQRELPKLDEFDLSNAVLTTPDTECDERVPLHVFYIAWSGNLPCLTNIQLNHLNIPYQGESLCLHNTYELVIKEGDTLLMTACRGGHIESVQMLLEKGCNVNCWSKLYLDDDFRGTKTMIRCSALTIAAFNDSIDICLLLIRFGADLVSSSGGYEERALDIYGNRYLAEDTARDDPKWPLFNARRELMKVAFCESLLGRLRKDTWNRRWPLFDTMVRAGLLSTRKSLPTSSTKEMEIRTSENQLDTFSPLPPIARDTKDANRTYLLGQVFTTDSGRHKDFRRPDDHAIIERMKRYLFPEDYREEPFGAVGLEIKVTWGEASPDSREAAVQAARGRYSANSDEDFRGDLFETIVSFI